MFFLTKGVDKLVTSGGFHDDDDEHHAFLYRLVFAACQRSKSCTYVMYVMYVRHVSHRDGYACRICVLDISGDYLFCGLRIATQRLMTFLSRHWNFHLDKTLT